MHSVIKRITLLLVAALMAAMMMVAMAAPAFAGPDCRGNPDTRHAASCKVDATGGNSKDTGAEFVGPGHKL